MYNWEDNKYLSYEEQLKLIPEDIKPYFIKTHINVVIIDNMEIHGYFEYSYLDEKNYNKRPQRTIGGVMNLGGNSSFLTSHLILKFKYLHIEDYRKVMKLIQSKDEVKVDCYDIVNDTRVTRNMYFAPQKMPLIHQINLQLQGVKDLSIELIGTNTDRKETVTIQYDYNFPNNQNASLYIYNEVSKEYDIIPILNKSASQEFDVRSSGIMGKTALLKTNNFDHSNVPINACTIITADNNKYKFKHWSDLSSTNDATNGFHYINGNNYYFLNKNTVYGQWEKSLNDNNWLKSLSVTGYSFDDNTVFDKKTLLYHITVPNSITSVTVNAIPEVNTSIAIVSGDKLLLVGNNTVNIDVKAEAGNIITYTIIVERQSK